MTNNNKQSICGYFYLFLLLNEPALGFGHDHEPWNERALKMLKALELTHR